MHAWSAVILLGKITEGRKLKRGGGVLRSSGREAGRPPPPSSPFALSGLRPLAAARLRSVGLSLSNTSYKLVKSRVGTSYLYAFEQPHTSRPPSAPRRAVKAAGGADIARGALCSGVATSLPFYSSTPSSSLSLRGRSAARFRRRGGRRRRRGLEAALPRAGFGLENHGLTRRRRSSAASQRLRCGPAAPR